MASSSSFRYNVFPCFHGPDVRKGLLSHLLEKFKIKGIKSFIDNEIPRGESIGPELIRAIKGSKIALVFLSKNYSSSSWCLDELVEILNKQLGQTIMTIFYDVDPTDVKKQIGDFGKAFGETCKGKTEEKIDTWTKALEDVATIAGYSLSNWDTEAAMVENIATYISNMLNLATRVTRVLREEPPSSKMVTITNFSVIMGRGEPYESSVFEAAGYKWRLVLYVNGNPNDGGNDHISLYVRIEETDSLPIDWEVNVDLKLFVHNGKLHKYLTVTDGTMKRYNNAKREWGFGQLIDLPTFHNTNGEYIEQDTGSFGAEIFIVKRPQQQEKVTFISNPPNNIFTWNILHFSTLRDRFYYSEDFLVEDRYWRLGFNPKGDGGGRPHALPIFLFAQGHKANAVATNTWGAVYLRLKNQRSTDHKQIYSAAWYPIRSGYGVGVNNIILLADLNDASEGYLVNDSIIFEAEMVKVSVSAGPSIRQSRQLPRAPAFSFSFSFFAGFFLLLLFVFWVSLLLFFIFLVRWDFLSFL